MARHTLRPRGRGYDLLLGAQRIGLVHRMGAHGAWALALDVGAHGYATHPAALREAADEDHPTLAALCAALGVVIGGLAIPATPNLPKAA